MPFGRNPKLLEVRKSRFRREDIPRLRVGIDLQKHEMLRFLLIAQLAEVRSVARADVLEMLVQHLVRLRPFVLRVSAVEDALDFGGVLAGSVLF